MMDYMAQKMDEQIEGSISENEALRLRIEYMQSQIDLALDCISEEINPNNYTHDLVHNFVNEYEQMVGILQDIKSVSI
jgi:hypothetical protein